MIAYNEILISICIPTYNRAEFLDKTIQSIVQQKIFIETFLVEIVISDNCSSDNTKEIAEKHIKNFKDKIRYFRNSENIFDQNYERSLSLGNGKYLKLNNDTLIHRQDSLEKMIEQVSKNVDSSTILVFSNGALKGTPEKYCNSLDSFINNVSFYSTWISCFGVWKKDFEHITDFNKHADLILIQTDILLRLVSMRGSVLVINYKLFESVVPSSKGGYNIYKVFVANYLFLLKQYRQGSQLSRLTLFREKTRLMLNFVIPWTILIWRNRSQYRFDIKGAAGIIISEYKFHPALYFGFFYFLLKASWTLIKETRNKISGS